MEHILTIRVLRSEKPKSPLVVFLFHSPKANGLKRQKGESSTPQWRVLGSTCGDKKVKQNFSDTYSFSSLHMKRQALYPLQLPLLLGLLNSRHPALPCVSPGTSSLLSPGLRRQNFLLLFLVVFVDFIDTLGFLHVVG